MNPKTLQGLDFSNPWQFINPNSPEMMQQVYNPVQTANANAVKISDDPQTPASPATTTLSMSSFGTPNWNYIFGSQMVQGLVNGIASRNPNSRSSGARQFNQQQFNPLNYLPSNPNVSTQDLFGGDFADGGMYAGDEEADYLFGDEATNIITPSTVEKSKRQMRMEGAAAEQQQDADYETSVMDFLSSLNRAGSNQKFQNVANFTEDADEVAKTVKNRLMAGGLPAHIASGFVGNFAAESSFRPGVTNGIGAFGLGQWLGDRKKNLFNFAQQQGKDASDPTVQADFVVHELQNGEKNAFGKIMASQNASEAAANIGRYYERPSASELSSSMGVRQAYAQKYAEGGEYENWKSKLPQNLQYEGDYDLRGLYESNPSVTPSANLHFPDTFKLPNHPTFSNESKYYDGVTPGMGGYWGEGDENYIKNPKIGPPMTPAYKEGGEYDLDSNEVERLRKLGYNVEIL